MPQIVRSIVTRLALDSKKFSSQISSSEKSILAFSGAVTAAGAAVFAIAKRTANYRDETTKLARSVGVPVQEFSELRHATEQAGLSLDDTRAIISKLSAPTEQQVQQLKGLGVELTNIDGSSTSTANRLGQLADVIAGISDPAQKTQVALRVFGEQGIKAISLLEQGSSGLDIVRQRARDLGIAFDKEAGQNAEKFNDSLDDLTKSITGAADSLGQAFINAAVSSNVFASLADAVSGVTRFFNSFDSDTQESIARIVAITAGVAGLAAAFIILRKVAVFSITTIGKTIRKNPLIFAISTIATGLIVAAEHFGVFNEQTSKSDEVTQATSKATKNLAKQLTGLTQNIRSTSTATDKNNEALTQQNLTFAEYIKWLNSSIDNQIKFLSGIRQVTSEASSLTDAYSGLVGQQTDQQIHSLEVQDAIARQSYEDQRDSLEDFYNDQIKAVRDGEQAKIDTIQNASNERLLLLNQEYQQAKEMAKRAFEQQRELERENYELEKEFLLEQALDYEQRQLTETLLDEDFRLYNEELEKQHEERLSNLQQNFLNKTKATETKTKKDIETINKKSAANVLSIEKKRDSELTTLDKKEEERQTAFEKEKARITYEGQKSQFENTKGIKIADSIASGAAGAAQAFASAASIPPPAGQIIGGIAAGLILTTTALRVKQIQEQVVPKPAVLQLQTGGILQGPRHFQGGIPTELEGGEAVIDRGRTIRLFEAIDRQEINPQPQIIINIEEGAIVNQGFESDEDLAEMISLKLAERLEGLGVGV